MKATYKGAEVAVHLFGTDFPRGVAVEVSDPHAAAKLATHPEFDASGDAPKPAPEKGRK